MAGQPEPDDNPPVRIRLGESLQSRDGTLTKDALITNGYVEPIEGGKVRVYKRSGLSTLFTPASGTGFGMTSLVNTNGVETLWYATASGTILPRATSISMTASNANTPIIGYASSLSGSAYASSAEGSITLGSYVGAYQVAAILDDPLGSGGFAVSLYHTGLARSYFTSVKVNSTTFLTSAATVTNSTSSTEWSWASSFGFANAVTYTVVFTI